MNPPDWLAAKVIPPWEATSIRWADDSLVKMMAAPASAQMSSAARLHRDRQGHPRVGLGLDDQAQQDEEGLVVGEHRALVVDDGEVLAARVDDRAEVGARGPDQVGDPRRARGAVERHHPRRVGRRD